MKLYRDNTGKLWREDQVNFVDSDTMGAGIGGQMHGWYVKSEIDPSGIAVREVPTGAALTEPFITWVAEHVDPELQEACLKLWAWSHSGKSPGDQEKRDNEQMLELDTARREVDRQHGLLQQIHDLCHSGVLKKEDQDSMARALRDGAMHLPWYTENGVILNAVNQYVLHPGSIGGKNRQTVIEFILEKVNNGYESKSAS